MIKRLVTRARSHTLVVGTRLAMCHLSLDPHGALIVVPRVILSSVPHVQAYLPFYISPLTGQGFSLLRAGTPSKFQV